MFYSSFPLKKFHISKKHKNWITLGILTSCKHKRELFTACGINNNPDLLKHYKNYCKILAAVIKEAKKLNYADKINPLNAELNPICPLLALGAHHILHVGRIRVNAVAVDKG
jgi:hypothetical protein